MHSKIFNNLPHLTSNLLSADLFFSFLEVAEPFLVCLFSGCIDWLQGTMVGVMLGVKLTTPKDEALLLNSRKTECALFGLAGHAISLWFLLYLYGLKAALL